MLESALCYLILSFNSCFVYPIEALLQLEHLKVNQVGALSNTTELRSQHIRLKRRCFRCEEENRINIVQILEIFSHNLYTIDEIMDHKLILLTNRIRYRKFACKGKFCNSSYEQFLWISLI